MDKSLMRGQLRSGPPRSAIYGGFSPDKKMVMHLVKELNNAWRQIRTYPEGHPAIAGSIQRVMKMFDNLFTRNSTITFSISDKLRSKGMVYLDRKNPLLRELSSLLSDHGILSSAFTQGLSSEELLAFIWMLGQRREKIKEQGGLEALFLEAKIHHITFQKVDCKAITIKDFVEVANKKNSAPLSEDGAWLRFTRALVTAQLTPDGNLRMSDGLARSLNAKLLEFPELLQKANRNLIREFESYDWDTLMKSNGSMDKLRDFLNQLEPILCAQLLSHFSVALAERPATAEEILSTFPVNAIIIAITERTVEGLATPPAIMNILITLATQNASLDPEKSSPDIKAQFKDYEIYDQFRAIFEEEDVDQYVSADYNMVLQAAIRAENIRPTGLIGSAELKDSLLLHRVERHFLLVVLELIACDDAPEPSPETMAKFSRICNYLQSVSDFASLSQVLERTPPPGDGPAERMVAGIFTTPEFVKKTLEGLDLCDKNRLPEACRMIVQVGAPFVEPLLDRLAVEEREDLRRFLIEQLIALGPLVLDAAIARLDDDRWYYVRNIVIILAGLGDPVVPYYLRRMADHAHHKVRHEVIRALQRDGDPDVTTLLSRELENDDPDVRIDAIKIAAKSTDPGIRDHLVGIVTGGGLSGLDLDYRIAAVRALSDMGDPSVLTVFSEVLRSRSIFRTAELAELKGEILKSLILYPPGDAAPLLRQTANSGSGPLADQAATMLRNPRYYEP